MKKTILVGCLVLLSGFKTFADQKPSVCHFSCEATVTSPDSERDTERDKDKGHHLDFSISDVSNKDTIKFYRALTVTPNDSSLIQILNKKTQVRVKQGRGMSYLSIFGYRKLSNRPNDEISAEVRIPRALSLSQGEVTGKFQVIRVRDSSTELYGDVSCKYGYE